MTFEQLTALLNRFRVLNIAVIGDYFLDHYLDIDRGLDELSVETGKVAFQVVQQRCAAGAAGTIVNNLTALGVGTIQAFGVIGDDGPGWELKRQLKRLGCDTAGLVAHEELMTPVYMKPCDQSVPGLAGEHSRLDCRTRTPAPEEAIDEMLSRAEAVLEDVDAVILLDQVEQEECQSITPRVREWAQTQAERHRDVIFWADSRFHIDRFRGLWIKPNQFEAVGRVPASPDDEVSIEEISQRLGELRQANGAPVTVTLGPRGLLVSDPQPTRMSAFPVDGPIDTTGAGDSLTAAMVAALCAGASQAEAGWLGNLVASLTIRQLGTTGTADPEQILGHAASLLQAE